MKDNVNYLCEKVKLRVKLGKLALDATRGSFVIFGANNETLKKGIRNGIIPSQHIGISI